MIYGAVLLATAAPVAHAQPTFTKAFAPDTIGPGCVSTLTFTITNASGSPVTDLAFTDNLPAGVTIATPAATFNFRGGTIELSDGSQDRGVRESINDWSPSPGSRLLSPGSRFRPRRGWQNASTGRGFVL